MNKFKIIFSLCAMFCILNSCSILRQEEDFSYNGIDISHYQGNINWDQLTKSKNIKYVYIKASEGATWTDSRRVEYARAAREKRILVGYYHFFRVSSTGFEQFENFCKATEGLPMDLIPVLDIEVEPKQSEMKAFEEGIKSFIYLCKKKFKVNPIIYTMPNFDKKYLPFCSKLKKWYAGRVNENAILSKTLIWQVAIQPVPGIAGNTDWDYCPKVRKLKKSWLNR